MKYRLGTRKSALALTQSNWVKSELEKAGLAIELVTIESSGDKDHTTPLYQIEMEGPGIFTKQLEKALLEKRIDLAVHSLKDLPTEQPADLCVGAVTEREDALDCLLISEQRYEATLAFGLPQNAKVGTSSLRREGLLLSARPDLKVTSLRGNVPTRIGKVVSGELDGVVLAQAGLNRLKADTSGLKRVALPLAQFVPAPGQGALAIEIRTDADLELKEALKRLHDPKTALETSVERRILRELEGGCTLPLGVYCRSDGKQLKLNAFLGLLKDKHAAVHQWDGFLFFDNFALEAEALVAKTVAYFRSGSHA